MRENGSWSEWIVTFDILLLLWQIFENAYIWVGLFIDEKANEFLLSHLVPLANETCQRLLPIRDLQLYSFLNVLKSNNGNKNSYMRYACYQNPIVESLEISYRSYVEPMKIFRRTLRKNYADGSFHYADIHFIKKKNAEFGQTEVFHYAELRKCYAGGNSHYAELRRTQARYAEDLARKRHIFQFRRLQQAQESFFLQASWFKPF